MGLFATKIVKTYNNLSFFRLQQIFFQQLGPLSQADPEYIETYIAHSSSSQICGQSGWHELYVKYTIS